MAYYRVCPGCGCFLDPGEICEDCRTEQLKAETAARSMAADPKTGQMTFKFEGRKNDAKKIAI